MQAAVGEVLGVELYPGFAAEMLLGHSAEAFRQRVAEVAENEDRGDEQSGGSEVLAFDDLAVLASLFSGLYFLYKDKGGSNRMVVALTIRIALSVLIFAILIGSYYFGWITERGL